MTRRGVGAYDVEQRKPDQRRQHARRLVPAAILIASCLAALVSAPPAAAVATCAFAGSTVTVR